MNNSGQIGKKVITDFDKLLNFVIILIIGIYMIRETQCISKSS